MSIAEFQMLLNFKFQRNALVLTANACQCRSSQNI